MATYLCVVSRWRRRRRPRLSGFSVMPSVQREAEPEVEQELSVENEQGAVAAKGGRKRSQAQTHGRGTSRQDSKGDAEGGDYL